jgi:hypothetical protein
LLSKQHIFAKIHAGLLSPIRVPAPLSEHPCFFFNKELLAVYTFAADPVSPNASQEARTVINYLNNTFGQKILAVRHGGKVKSIMSTVSRDYIRLYGEPI